MNYEIRLNDLAFEDLDSIQFWIELEADATVADAYVSRIRARFLTLAAYPNRGTPRDDVAPGLRTLSFERRLRICYRVDGQVVEIVRVVSVARELEPLFER